MEVRFFYTTGKQDIIESTYDKPEPEANEIEVMNIMTGVCRSDIDMYNGDFELPSIYMQGHEGIGQVTKVGEDVYGVEVGNYVATRGEPAFADWYNVKTDEFVIVPEAHPKYIIEPVACAINLYFTVQDDIDMRSEIIILGTGFLATVLLKTLRWHGCFNPVTVVGNANKEFWENARGVAYYTTLDEIPEKNLYNMVFDLSPKPEYVNIVDRLANNGTIIMGAEKHPNVPLPIDKLLWKAAKIEFPSPRNELFIDAMERGVDMIDDGTLDTSPLWTMEYDRTTEVEQAFLHGTNRPEGYSRGYIVWGVNCKRN